MNPALLRYLIEGVKPLWGLRKGWSSLFRKPVTTGKARILPAETTRLGPGGKKLPRGGTRDIPARPSPVFDTTTIPGGLLRRRPGLGVSLGLAGTGIAGGTAYSLLSGDDKPDEETTGPSRAELMRKREQAESDALAAK